MKGNGIEFNHKIMIKVQESPPNIMVTRKSMVCDSLGKGLVVQGEDASLLVHPTQGMLHFCLIVFPGEVSIYWYFLRSKADLPYWAKILDVLKFKF